MTRRLTPPTLIITLTAFGMPNLLTESPDTPFITLTALDLSPTANTRIGVDETGRVIAIVTTDDGEITEIGLATLDTDDNLIFGQAELINTDGNLLLQMAKAGGTLMNGDRTLKFDPRELALKMVKMGLGKTVDIVAKGEGGELSFGASIHVGQGTKGKLTTLTVAGKTMGTFQSDGDGIQIVVALTKAGQTWIAVGDIGSVDHETRKIDEVNVSALAAFGIGLPPTRMAHSSARATVAA